MKINWFDHQHIEQLPIHPINFFNRDDKSRHDNMVSLFERMQELHKRSAAAKDLNDKIQLWREIEVTDRQIDQLVYELYGLTEEEIEIVGDGIRTIES